MGYAAVNETKTNEYEVTHPSWLAYPIKEYKINTDFGLIYGEQFSFLNTMQPHSVMLAEGSTITVETKKTIN